MKYLVDAEGSCYEVEIEESDQNQYRISMCQRDENGEKGEPVVHKVDCLPGQQNVYSLIVGHKAYEVDVDVVEDKLEVLVQGQAYFFRVLDERRKRLESARAQLQHSGEQIICSPMPGKVVAFKVKVGDKVEKGQGIVIVEAMKMENEIQSNAAGKVKKILAKVGDNVDSNQTLVVIK